MLRFEIHIENERVKIELSVEQSITVVRYP